MVQAAVFWQASFMDCPSYSFIVIAEVAASQSFTQMGVQLSARFRITVFRFVAASMLSFVLNVIMHHMPQILAIIPDHLGKRPSYDR